MRILLVEDDFISRNVMNRFLTGMGQVEAVNDGKAAWEAYEKAMKRGRHFELVIIDATVPALPTGEVLRLVKGLQDQLQVPASVRTRVLVTCALDDVKAVNGSFRELCDGYLMKPARKPLLVEKLQALGLAVTAG